MRDGRAGAALLLSPFDRRGLDSEQLITEPFMLAMASAVPLAARMTLRLADLNGWVLPDGSPADQGRPFGHQAPSPGAPQDPSDLPQIFKLVELGSIVCFFPASLTARFPRPEIDYRRVEDADPAALSVAWPRNSRSAAVAAFVRAAVKVAAAASAPVPGLDG